MLVSEVGCARADLSFFAWKGQVGPICCLLFVVDASFPFLSVVHAECLLPCHVTLSCHIVMLHCHVVGEQGSKAVVVDYYPGVHLLGSHAYHV